MFKRIAIANENETDKPTYPTYSKGGWNANPGSCNKGFKPNPSKGGSIFLAKGFEVNNRKIQNKKRIIFWTPNTVTWNAEDFIDLLFAIKYVKNDKINIHNKIEPSWLPHNPEIL